jgi:hypothetical protein
LIADCSKNAERGAARMPPSATATPTPWYFEALRVRHESEAKMLDADVWSKRIGNLHDPGATEPKAMTEAQFRKEDEDEARRILDETQTPAFQTMDAEVEEIEIDDIEVQQPIIEPPRVKPAEVQHSAIETKKSRTH